MLSRHRCWRAGSNKGCNEGKGRNSGIEDRDGDGQGR